MVPVPTPFGSHHPNPVSPQGRKPQVFSKKTMPAGSHCFLPLASAWPPRAQCTQNYNVLTQAGTHGEDSHLGRHTPGAGRHQGHSEAEITRIYIFSRGRLKYNFHEDCIMDYCLRKLWQRTKKSLSFPKGAFSSTGVEREGCCFYFLKLTWDAVVIMCDSFLSKSPCDCVCVYFIWTTQTQFVRADVVTTILHSRDRNSKEINGCTHIISWYHYKVQAPAQSLQIPCSSGSHLSLQSSSRNIVFFSA